jgi:uncharacterized protein (TIGR00297 family)
LFFSPYPLLEAFGVSLLCGLIAWSFGTVTIGGFTGGVTVGGIIYYFAGWPGFVVLGGFFILGSALTRLGYSRKETLGAAQESGGRRGASHALANCTAGIILGIAYWLTGGHPLAGAAFVAAFAAAAADTSGTEIGALYGKTAILPTTFRRVPAGTSGAISIAGTVASLLASGALVFLGSLAGLVVSPKFFSAAFLGGFSGAFAESILGAMPRVHRLLGHDGLNLLNTVLGAIFCIFLALLLNLH